MEVLSCKPSKTHQMIINPLILISAASLAIGTLQEVKKSKVSKKTKAEEEEAARLKKEKEEQAQRERDLVRQVSEKVNRESASKKPSTSKKKDSAGDGDDDKSE